MRNGQKMKSFTDRKVLRSRTNCAKVKERNAFKHNVMSTDTQDFIQKICYRKTASIDMTQNGFINDSKVNPVNYMMKPLRVQLEKICVKPAPKALKRNPSYHYSSVLPRAKLRENVSSTEQKPHCVPKSAKPVVAKCHYSTVLPRDKLREAVTSTERKPPCIPKSALSCPGTRSSRNRCRVRIQSEPNSSPAASHKKVKVVSPSKNNARTPSKN